MTKYLEDTFETEERSLEEKVILPSKSTLKGRRWDEWDKDSRERTIENCDGRLVVSHTDADGFVSASLFMDYFDEVSVVNVDYEEMEDTFEFINENTDNIDELYVSDLNLDEVYPVIVELVGDLDKFVWLDHHKWGEEEQKLSFIGVDITINEDRCAAGVVLDYLQDRGYEPDRTTLETVELTEDHDLWHHEMEKVEMADSEVCISKIFSQVAFYSDDDDFMENILDYGYDFMEHEGELLRDGKDKGFVEKKEKESMKKLNYVLENHTEIKDIGGYKVALCYGRSPPGELLEELGDEDVDILAQAKPSYPVKVSFRSVDGFEKCHKIAEELGGGGHEQAAACRPEMIRNPLDFFEYIGNRDGGQVLSKAEEAIRKVVEE